MSFSRYYAIAHKGSLDLKHPGMKLLISLSKNAERVLDMGCGEGTRLNLLAGKAKRASGVDINKEAISLATKNYPGLEFVVGNLEKLPFEDASFDLVYSAFAFEHLESPEKVISEATRVLSPEGTFVVIAPNFGAPNRASPPFKGSRMKKLINGFYRDFFPGRGLGWQKVKPITKGYEPDWDTQVEPYILSLERYFKSKNLRPFYTNSCWSRELAGAKTYQKIFRFLGEQGLFPFSVWGPHLVLGVKKQEPCVICDKTKFRTLFRAQGKNIERCNNCGLARTQDFTFPDYKSYHRDKEYQESRKLFENIFLKRVRTIEKFKKRGKVLEIGCSIGTLLGLFKDKGWEV